MIGAVTNTETVTLSFATATSDVLFALEEVKGTFEGNVSHVGLLAVRKGLFQEVSEVVCNCSVKLPFIF